MRPGPLGAYFCWLDAVYLAILPFSDQEVVPVKRRDFYGVEFMFICEAAGEKFVGCIQKDGDPADEERDKFE